MTGAVLFISLTIFLILNVPVGISIGLSTLAAALFNPRMTDTFIVQHLIAGSDSFPLMAIPLFILAGDLMGAGGVSRRIINVVNAFLGRLTGGVAIVTVVVCMFFAAVSGSGPATVAAIGSIMVPAMVERGYDKSFALAVAAAAGSIGVIIPPSIPMVIYGVGTGTSITGLFMGGFMPGILIGLALIALCYIYCKKKGWRGTDEVFTMKEKLQAVWDAKWALINPLIILGGIYGGLFTPTEAAAVAAVYAFICGVFFYKELDAKKLYKTIANACSTTGTTMAIIGCATAFTKLLTIEQIPMKVTNVLVALSDSRVIILLLINILLLIVGMVMDTTPAMMVLAPILLPVARSVGLSPIHFGLIMVVNLAIGFLTPPLGINLFVASRVGNTKLEVVLKDIPMFIATMLLCLMLITYIPAITETLPRLLGINL
ncbi:TRAP transporter large permease [Tepidanaerobacter sp. EBM-38]|uniref:TRAP transporter large permease n=1 Tax=Tepidanaerobacter sp. EBM-38 TaxID=1918496 RepID=UPI000AA5CB51|nr:TRAP transporter large permease [Tepidanaerobacter sp. EBM-38]